MKKIALLVSLVGFNVYGFSRFSGRGEGVCRSYSGLALGYEACGWNPAMLGVSPDYSFNIMTIGLEYNSNLRFSDYMRIINGVHFSERDKEMFSEGEELEFLGSAQVVSFSYRDIGVMSSAYTHQSFTIPKDVVDLLFWGNEIDRTYSLENIRGKSEMGFGIVLSGARVFGEGENFMLGGGFKYIYGISYTDICNSSGYLRTEFYSSDEPKIYGEGEIVSRTAEGGFGLGMDLGAYYKLHNYFISVSVINAFSEMIWDIGARTVKASFKLSPVDLETFDPNSSLKWEETEYKKPFTTTFEPRIDFSAGLNKEQFCITGGTGYPRLFSIGGEVSYGVIVLRSGISVEDKRLWFGGGIGVIKRVLHLDIGLRGNSSSHFSGSLSVSVIPEKRAVRRLWRR